MLAEPWLLASILVIAPLVWLALRRRRQPSVTFPSLAVAKSLAGGLGTRLRYLPLILRCMVLALLAFALARPQASNIRSMKTSEGLDIVLVVDTSRSMEARDFVIAGERPRRLDVIKKVIADFVAARPDDRIGMVVFGSEAFTQSPLTLDHVILSRFLERVSIGMAGDATAIGDGLATAVNRLKGVEAKSKLVILLTDGTNNAGRVDPMAAAQAAKALGVKVYTVGAGSEGMVPIVIDGRMQTQKVDIDEKLMQEMAELTGGKYFRATDTESLVKVYETIDKLEKTRVKVDSFERHDERFRGLVASATALALVELLFALTRFRSLP